MQIKQLNTLATEMVGDGQSPNLFFVSIKGNIMLVTPEFDTAYDYWRFMPRDVETALEDRQNGVLASTEPVEDESNRLVTYDDARRMIGMVRA